MPARLPSAASLLLLLTAVLASEHQARLLIRADPAIVDLDESRVGLRYVRLPALEFPLRIQPFCPPGAWIDSVSVSVADTRDTFNAGAFEEKQTLETMFRVPAQQIGPLPVEHFCTAGDSDADRPVLRIPDVLTAQASLRCVTEARQLVVYDAISLHVELRCRRPAPDSGGP